MYDYQNDPERLYELLFVRMSGNFLSNTLPVESIDWEQEQELEWIEENKWEPLECFPADDIWELILSATNVSWQFMERNAYALSK